MLRKVVYKVGGKVVYPSQGIGVVEDVVEKNIQNSKQSFYVIRIVDTGATIMSPVDRAAEIGIREVSNNKDVTKAIKILKDESAITPSENWNKRQKNYLTKLKAGCFLDIAEVYRDLSLLQSAKILSFGERKILENVRQLLSDEIAAAKDIGIEKAAKMIEKAVFDSRDVEPPSLSVN
ncbi:MAG: CarD family transcriptional regulator [Nitrospinota bacterium]